MKLRKKLIEVALPLEAINKASAREKSIRHGHPSTLHLWWARRPLAAARAVIFSQMVDDPSEYVDTLKMDDKLRKKAEKMLKDRHAVWVTATEVKRKADAAGIDSPDPGPEPTLDDIIAEQERDRLFKIIEDLVLWENTTNETVLDKARAEIWQSWRRTCADNADHPRAAELFDRHKLPAFHDPFAGGGTLPLEAQRLGLESYASDLNPVAVLINRAMIELPPKFAGMAPVNPEWQSKSEAEKSIRVWKGSEGLADDVRYYGQWMRDEAEKQIGHLYPKVRVTSGMAATRPDLKKYVGEELTVIAWIWARTVKSPNPAFRDVDVPLAASFVLSKKPGADTYIEPIFNNGTYTLEVKVGDVSNASLPNGTKLARGANFQCLMSSQPIESSYIKEQGMAGKFGEKLLAIVAQGKGSQLFLSPDSVHENTAKKAKPTWRPDVQIAPDPKAMWTIKYGLDNMGDLFSDRQTVALTTFADLVEDVGPFILRTADSNTPEVLQEYSKAIMLYLALAVGRSANYWSAMTPWGGGFIVQTFGRQGIPLVWDHAEGNPFSNSTGNWTGALDWIERVIEFALPAFGSGLVFQEDAQVQSLSSEKVVSTDPPYYHYIGYSDLADFFYVWHKRALKGTFPELYSTITTPKVNELVALPYRHENKKAADGFFLDGMTLALGRLAKLNHKAFPTTIYYAFKQAETGDASTTRTGWETFLEAVIQAGFGIVGTWPREPNATKA